MNSNNKSPVVVLFAIALLTGFMSIVYTQSAHALSVDPNGLPGIDGNPAFDLLKGHKGIKGDTNAPGSPSPAGKGTGFGHLIVKVHTVDSFNQFEPIQSSDFTIHVSGNQQSPDAFPGSESGTDVKVGIGSYQVTEDMPDTSNTAGAGGGGQISVHFGQGCSDVMHNSEDKTCTITNTIR